MDSRSNTNTTRRQLLRGGLASTALAISSPLRTWGDSAGPGTGTGDILVVLELSGGNDGLNTVVPFRNDAYYRARPSIGLPQKELLGLDDDYGFNPGALGLKRLWDQGELAIVHGCGYADPSYSHFTSMGYWHTAAPNSGATHGWLGRLADELQPEPEPNFLVNIASTQSLAVTSSKHTPVVFDDPNRFQRAAFSHQQSTLAAQLIQSASSSNSNQRFLRRVAKGAVAASKDIQNAWANYNSPIDYGIASLDLPKVAACIAHGFPARLYYTSFRNNAFDTHVQQGPLHQRLLSYAGDALHGFLADMKRLGAHQRVTVLVFSEFGRRLAENANAGTDHGSANLMFLAGGKVKGGHYGAQPSLTTLNAQDNLVHTTDFRQVYATAIAGALGSSRAEAVLGKHHSVLPIF